MNSNMTLTVINLQTDPKVQQDFKGQYSQVKGQSVSHHGVAHLKPSTGQGHGVAHLHPLTNVPTKYQFPTSLAVSKI